MPSALAGLVAQNVATAGVISGDWRTTERNRTPGVVRLAQRRRVREDAGPLSAVVP